MDLICLQRRGEERRGEERRPCGEKKEQEVLTLSFISSCLGQPSEVWKPLRACQPYSADLSSHTATTKKQKAQRISVFILVLLMISCVYCNMHIQNWRHRPPEQSECKPSKLCVTMFWILLACGTFLGFPTFISQNHHWDLMGYEWHSSWHHSCGTLEIVPRPAVPGPRPPLPPQAPQFPWSPKRCLAFHTPSLNKALL